MLFLFKYVGFRILDDSLPADSDTSTAADLTRINYYTQVLFETKTRLLNSAELDVIWKIVAEVSYSRQKYNLVVSNLKLKVTVFSS